MTSLLVDFITASTRVQDTRMYSNDDINKCFIAIHKDMVGDRCSTVRIHIRKDGRWVLVGNFNQDAVRGMIDDSMCS